eukprot:jgi/Mesen1/7790/ME000408S06911
MGVHGLWDLLAPVGRRVSVDALSNKRVAVDASIWIAQFMKAIRDREGEMLRNAHLLGFFRRICKLLFLKVRPVFVFDGGTPALKRSTVLARRRQREQAQNQIRKTAEKLLLNHLRTRKLEEAVGNISTLAKKLPAGGRRGRKAKQANAAPATSAQPPASEVREAQEAPEPPQADTWQPPQANRGSLKSQLTPGDAGEPAGPSSRRGQEGEGSSRRATSGPTPDLPGGAPTGPGPSRGPPSPTSGARLKQEEADAQLAASLAAAEEGEEGGEHYKGSGRRHHVGAPAMAALPAIPESREDDGHANGNTNGEEEDDDDEDDHMILLPEAGSSLDPAVLAALPTSVHLELMVQMRERLVAENREKFQQVAKAPQSFSSLQIEAYLKTVAMRRSIHDVQRRAAAGEGGGIAGVPSSRIASETDREFIFSSSFSGAAAAKPEAGSASQQGGTTKPSPKKKSAPISSSHWSDPSAGRDPGLTWQAPPVRPSSLLAHLANKRLAAEQASNPLGATPGDADEHFYRPERVLIGSRPAEAPGGNDPLGLMLGEILGGGSFHALAQVAPGFAGPVGEGRPGAGAGAGVGSGAGGGAEEALPGGLGGAPQQQQQQQQQKRSPFAGVHTYMDHKGRVRVNRARGMGVRMTRDLQWNLHLMKDREEQQERERARERER